MKELTRLFSLPTSLVALTLTHCAAAQELPWPHNLPRSDKYYPEHEAHIKRGQEIQERLQWDQPAGLKKMGDDPGEKFYLDYWQFESQRSRPIIYEDLTGYANASDRCMLLSPLAPHTNHERIGSWLFGRSLWARDFQCPSGTTACSNIDSPLCCGGGETCVINPGGIGCCPNGATCGESVAGCDTADGYTSCPNGGGCCVPGASCSGTGCVFIGTQTTTTTLPTATVTTGTVNPTTESSGGTTVIVTSGFTTTVTISASGGTVTTTVTSPTTIIIGAGSTSTCTSGFFSCGSDQGGGCCRNGQVCQSNSCEDATTTTTATASAAFRPTSSASTSDTAVSAAATSTTTTTASLNAAGCPTGFYMCEARYLGGCCRVDRNCETTSCPMSDSTAVLTSGETIGVNYTSSSCANGWSSCAANQGGGCCPTGYACGASCVTSSGDETQTLAKETGSRSGSATAAGEVKLWVALLTTVLGLMAGTGMIWL